METPLYFAFGSNMLYKRIADRLGPVRRVGTYSLPNYRLTFSAGLWQAVGNVERDYTSQVEGVLYELTDSQIALLDRYEGVPETYQKRFFIVRVSAPTLRNPDRIVQRLAFLYVDLKPSKEPKQPILSYLNLIIDGAEQNGLLTTYNKLVEYKLANYPLKSSRHKLKK
jgi:hypothetical protein